MIRILPFLPGILTALVLGGGGLWFHFNRVGDLKDEIQILNIINEAQTNDAVRSVEQAAKVQILEKQLYELGQAVSQPDTECFTPDDTDRLRSLWDETISGPTKYPR